MSEPKNTPPPSEASTTNQGIEDGRCRRRRITGLLGACSGICKPNDAMVSAYITALKDLSTNAVFEAIDELVRTADDHVPPARIRRQALGEVSAGAEIAWQFYLARLNQVGVFGCRADDHPDIRAQRAFITVGAAPGMNTNIDNLPAVRRAFVEAYNRPEASKRR